MKFKIIALTAAVLVAGGRLHAQYGSDALRFSQTEYGSTARFKAVGGAQIGVGGDLSSLAGNPAGLGLFTKSEISLTPEFNGYNTKTNFLNSASSGNGSQMNLNNAAVLWHTSARKSKGSDLTKGWLSFNFGLAYHRDANFGNDIQYSGKNNGNANTATSITDYFTDLANFSKNSAGALPAGSLESMAYKNYLISYNSTTKNYFTSTSFDNTQNKSDNRRGGKSEVSLALGGNYSNQLYLGASLNFASLNYTSDADYIETGFNSDTQVMDDYNLSFRQNQITSGSGFNGKLGLIFRPEGGFRIGLTVETPTFYTITDRYAETLDTKYKKDAQPYTNPVETYDYTYNLRTPAKFSGGLSYFFGGQGFIAADIDYVDYSSIKFSTPGSNNNDVILDNNNFIVDNYQSAMNYRVGGELKLDQVILRAGYGVQGSPYQEGTQNAGTNFEINTASGGLGYRKNNYYVDLTYQNINYNSRLRAYTVQGGDEPVAAVKNTRNNVFLTIGTRF